MSDGPLRPVCALGTSPKGGGKMETGETNCRVAMTGRGTWLPLWGPIPLIKGKCPEGTKGIGILARRQP